MLPHKENIVTGTDDTYYWISLSIRFLFSLNDFIFLPTDSQVVYHIRTPLRRMGRWSVPQISEVEMSEGLGLEMRGRQAGYLG